MITTYLYYMQYKRIDIFMLIQQTPLTAGFVVSSYFTKPRVRVEPAVWMWNFGNSIINFPLAFPSGAFMFHVKRRIFPSMKQLCYILDRALLMYVAALIIYNLLMHIL